MKEIAKAYDHNQFEENIYKHWEDSGYFRPEINMSANPKYDREIDGKPFVISMPPPNITGKLHVGHSLFITLQDIMIRYHRLKGEPTLWLPGTDHAGIATQTVVDKMLKKKGIDKRDLGREKFIEEVWKWKEEYGSTITKQLRRMGASCDWSRERFTFDEGLNKAVRKAFVDLYKKGLIYRGEYIVNWCPKCGTAIADDEVEHAEQEAKLYYFKYDQNFPITIATTRPETKLGDTGVAVNPKDKRYQEFVGKTYEVNIDGLKRSIVVFADRSVDMEFGTGAVGVTPAHSAVDWKMGQEHGLKVIKVINENAKMTALAGEKYAGLKTLEAREKLIQYLKESDLLVKEEKVTNNLSICYRCGGTIEPLPSLQWFVKMKEMANRAKTEALDGKLDIIPERFKKVYINWMENIRDWCISRQIWWGHQIPVWYKADEIYCGMEAPKEAGWIQDPDVLDTWFSSALWPFSTLGWPDYVDKEAEIVHPLQYAKGMTSRDYGYFYPTTVMETGYDILPFWVARMATFGLEFTDKNPFETVYFHGLVRDEHNRKMSKSLGNVLDPLDVIPKYGTDALRMALVVGSTPGQDLAVGEAKIKGYRNFSNKIWNASRFVILRVTGGDLKTGEIGQAKLEDLDIDLDNLTAADKEILQFHASIIKSSTDKLDHFRFSQAGEELYEYFWHQFCDVYIEAAKIQLDDEKTKENTEKILIKILKESLILLHPFVPFVTEAVWQELQKVSPDISASVMVAQWPK